MQRIEHSKNNLSLVRIGLLLPVVLSLWWLLLEPVILPSLEIVAGSMLEYTFSSKGIQINSGQDMNWVIHTNLILEGQAALSTLVFELNFNHMTLGFPLLWLFCFAFYQRPQGLNVLVGSLCLLLLINLGVFLQVSQQIYNMMIRDDIVNQYLGVNNIVPIDVPATFWLQFLSLCTQVLFYLVVFIFPLAYSYWVNSEQILEMLKAKQEKPKGQVA